MITEKLFTTAEAARLLGISRVRVNQLCQDGTINAVKVGRDYVITRDAIEAARDRPKKAGWRLGRKRKSA